MHIVDTPKQEWVLGKTTVANISISSITLITRSFTDQIPRTQKHV